MTDLSIKTKPETAITKVRPGHWRNEWHVGHSWTTPCGRIYDTGAQLADIKFPSRELAEAYADKWFRERMAPGNPYCVRYLGPVFFPENEPPA